ncbi:MAG: Dabb family protein [Flavobacteriaceae bacterium]|nr:Dabb family protein [Flavobacteriaceae bacterium]
MKRRIFVKLGMVFTVLGLILGTACSSDDDGDAPMSPSKTIRHIVLFKYKESVTKAQKDEVISKFMALKQSKKDGETYIRDIEYGYQNSKEGVSRGYEIAFLVSFNSIADRDYYVGQPFITEAGKFDAQHDAFKAFVGPLLATENGVLVYDYDAIKM